MCQNGGRKESVCYDLSHEMKMDKTENKNKDGFRFDYRDPDRKPRKQSDDITSLDSWSEIRSPDFSTKVRRRSSSRHSTSSQGSSSGENESRNDQLILDPSKLSSLCTIDEPPEPKVARVKLQKGSTTCSPNDRFLFVMLPNKSKSVENISGENSSSRVMNNTDPSNNSDYSCPNCHSNFLNTASRSLPYCNCNSVGRHIYSNNHGQQVCTCQHCVQKYINKHKADFHKHSKSNHFRHHHKGHVLFPPHANKTSDFRHNAEQVDQVDRLKNKFVSALNNVKYGWTLKTKTNFRVDSPIFLLGRCYHKRPDDEDPEPGHVTHTPPSMQLFKRDFESRLWFTYRRDFAAMPNTRFSTDCGWGCMLRSGQMMIAQGLINHFLGRDWRVYNQTIEQETFYRQIIQWFGDSVSDQCPFSVHHLASIGKRFGKEPGDWYGPSSTAYIFRDALNKAPQSQPVLKDLCVYVAQDCTVYKQDVLDLCTSRSRTFTSSVDLEPDQLDTNSVDGEWNRSVIIMVPVRLGGEEFNPVYSACVKNLMAQDCCLGIIGGKPKHSLYFIGWQEDKLIHLDPHFCQDYVDTLKRDFKIESFHCFSPRKISLSKMDPSATVGFYCRSRAEFDKFVEQTEQMVTPNKASGQYPMFVFAKGKGEELDLTSLSLSEERYLRIHRVELDSEGRARATTIDSEEFVVL